MHCVPSLLRSKTFCSCVFRDLTFFLNNKIQIFVRPILCRDAVLVTLTCIFVQVMCLGVRNMRKFHLTSVTSPSVEVEVGGQIVKSNVIRNARRNPNFDDPLLFFDIVSKPDIMSYISQSVLSSHVQISDI